MHDIMKHVGDSAALNGKDMFQVLGLSKSDNRK